VLGPAPESGKIPDEEMDDYDDEEDDYEAWTVSMLPLQGSMATTTTMKAIMVAIR
jgi:hypothetical protein